MSEVQLSTPPEPQILRVATYNIHKGVQGLGPARRLEIHNLGLAVEQLDADIVCLQEVRKMNRKEEQYFDRWPNVPQAEYLAPEGYESVYLTNAYTRDGEHGNALLSKFAIRHYENLDVSVTGSERRGLLHAVLDVPGQRPLHTVCAHLGLDERQRVKQLRLLCRLLDSLPAEAPVIVAGDFNDWRQRADQHLAGCGLVEVFTQAHGRPARSFPARWPLLCLDRIYVRNAQARQPRVMGRKPWSHLSDHLPLFVEVLL